MTEPFVVPARDGHLLVQRQSNSRKYKVEMTHPSIGTLVIYLDVDQAARLGSYLAGRPVGVAPMKKDEVEDPEEDL